MTAVLILRENLDTEADMHQAGRQCGGTRGEDGHLQAKEGEWNSPFSHDHQNPGTPWFWIPSLQNCDRIHFCCVSISVDGGTCYSK